MPCQLHVVPGMYHGADSFAARAPAMVEFHASLAAALRVAIGGEKAAVDWTGHRPCRMARPV